MFWLTFISLATAESTSFTQNNAMTLEEQSWSVGVFSPLRFGLKEDLELSIHPGWAILAPHLAIKKSHGQKGDWYIAARHQVGYPTPLLRGLARGGTGGVLPPDTTIPSTITLHNDLFATKQTDAGTMTVSTGLNLAIALGESDYPTIDYAYGFRQTNLYQNWVSLSVGFGWETMFSDNWGFRTWSKGYYYPTAEERWVVEQRDTILWQVSDGSQASLGLNLSVAEYPWGVQWHAFPAFDWAWIW